MGLSAAELHSLQLCQWQFTPWSSETVFTGTVLQTGCRKNKLDTGEVSTFQRMRGSWKIRTVDRVILWPNSAV